MQERSSALLHRLQVLEQRVQRLEQEMLSQPVPPGPDEQAKLAQRVSELVAGRLPSYLRDYKLECYDDFDGRTYLRVRCVLAQKSIPKTMSWWQAVSEVQEILRPLLSMATNRYAYFMFDTPASANRRQADKLKKATT